MPLTTNQIKYIESKACSYADFMRIAKSEYNLTVDFYYIKSLINDGLLSQEALDRNNRSRKDAEMFVANKALTKSMKGRVIEMRGGCCERCGNPGEWNGQPLMLQVHHVDGNRFNSTLDNLMVLCPNCHALTDNFGAKNIISSVNEDLIRSLATSTTDIAEIISLADLPLTANTIQLVRDVLSS